MTGPSGIAELNGAAVPNATNATNATAATTALTANNALSLGGMPASAFTRKDCASDTGQVKGFAQTPEAVPATFVGVGNSYNCSGGPVEARKAGTGKYIYKFADNPAEVALATAIGGNGAFRAAATVKFHGAGEWEVATFENNVFIDEGIELVLF